MTLANLIREYLENRRKICEQKIRCLDWANNFQFYSERDQDEKFCGCNTQYYSNNTDTNSPDKKNNHPGRFSQKHVTRQIGVSRSSRVVTLPDGTTQTETVIRDSNGNEEKHITHQKGDKKYTTIIRKDAAGIEHIEQKVTDLKDNNKFEIETYFPNSFSDKSSDSGFNFRFHKFFKPPQDFSDSGKHENMPFDYSTNFEEQMDNIMKGFGQGTFFDMFNETFNNTKPSNEQETFSNGFIPGNFSKFSDETLKFLENFEKETSKSNQKNSRKKNGNSNMQKQLNAVIKSITPSPPPSMFEKFAENAMIEIPEEKTELDPFIQKEEDYQNELSKVYGEKLNVITKLEKKFLPRSQDRKDFYSDIEEEKDFDLSEMFPKPETNFTPNTNGFGDTILKAFDPKNFYGGHTQRKIHIENGKTRVESIWKNNQSNTEKNITYQVGNKSYSIVIVFDKYGKQIKKERQFNFPEDELSDFKNQWSKNFHSDFDE